MSDSTHRGGTRPGAGRKSLPPEAKRIRKTISVLPNTADWLTVVKQPNETYGAVIDRLVIQITSWEAHSFPSTGESIKAALTLKQ